MLAGTRTKNRRLLRQDNSKRTSSHQNDQPNCDHIKKMECDGIKINIFGQRQKEKHQNNAISYFSFTTIRKKQRDRDGGIRFFSIDKNCFRL